MDHYTYIAKFKTSLNESKSTLQWMLFKEYAVCHHVKRTWQD